MADRVYVAQVMSLFSSVTASSLMAAIFLINVYCAYEVAVTSSFLVLGALGCLLNIWRISAAIVLRRLASARVLSRHEATRFQAHFAVPYIGFSAVLGLFGFLIFRRPEPQLHMLTVCVAVGYCAGVATNCGLRPRLALTSIALGIGPIICASLMREDATYSAMAFVATAFVLGAARSLMVRANESRTEIAARITSVTLARRDDLTSLPNRLALHEFFDERRPSAAPYTHVAVHYLDLNGFKPVNDQHGHLAGDELLHAVAKRLKRAVRETDMVARLGGDEFAVVQFGLSDPEEAHSLAWRIRDVIEQPFEINQSIVSISTSIGTIISPDRSISLSDLLQQADAELYRVKRARKKLQLVAAV